MINIWRLDQAAYNSEPGEYPPAGAAASGGEPPAKKRKDGSGPVPPRELLFQHVGEEGS